MNLAAIVTCHTFDASPQDSYCLLFAQQVSRSLTNRNSRHELGRFLGTCHNYTDQTAQTNDECACEAKELQQDGIRASDPGPNGSLVAEPPDPGPNGSLPSETTQHLSHSSRASRSRAQSSKTTKTFTVYLETLINTNSTIPALRGGPEALWVRQGGVCTQHLGYVRAVFGMCSGVFGTCSGYVRDMFGRVRAVFGIRSGVFGTCSGYVRACSGCVRDVFAMCSGVFGLRSAARSGCARVCSVFPGCARDEGGCVRGRGQAAEWFFGLMAMGSGAFRAAGPNLSWFFGI